MGKLSGWGGIALCTAGVAVLVIAGFVFQLLWAAGQFKTLDPAFIRVIS